MVEPLRELTRFNGAKRPPTLRPIITTWDASQPVGFRSLHPPSPFIIITQPESRCSFYHPADGIRLSRPSYITYIPRGFTRPSRLPISVLTGKGGATVLKVGDNLASGSSKKNFASPHFLASGGPGGQNIA